MDHRQLKYRDVMVRDLRARDSQQQLRADFEACLDGFSLNVQDILEVRVAVAVLPPEVLEPEPLEGLDALAEAEYDTADDLDAALEEVEA